MGIHIELKVIEIQMQCGGEGRGDDRVDEERRRRREARAHSGRRERDKRDNRGRDEEEVSPEREGGCWGEEGRVEKGEREGDRAREKE